MRALRAWLPLLLLTMTVTGCALREKRDSWFPRLRPFRGMEGADVVRIEVALLEVPLGDRYVNETLWELADEQCLPLERKAITERNGFRIGLVGSSPPSELLALLTSRRSNPKPHAMQVRAGKKAPALELGPIRAVCRFEIPDSDEVNKFELKDAVCRLSIVAELTEDGRTRLRFTPEVEHGEVGSEVWKPNEEKTDWMMLPDRPVKAFEDPGWSVTLAPGEYLVIGGRFEMPTTLGHQAFLYREERMVTQKVLVIRTTRSNPPEKDSAPVSHEAAKKVAPIALQAHWSARGSSE